MKLAILGTGPMAMELALFFHLEGAMVKMIGPQTPGGKLHKLANHPKACELGSSVLVENLSAWGREFTQLKELEAEGSLSYQQLWENYYSKIGAYLASEKVFVPRDLIRVQKQFLHHDEEIKNRTRLLDLFRVTYGLNASGLVDQQLAENPELADKIGTEILESLKNQVESFEDFDLVIDARGPFQESLKMGTGGDYALNELPLAHMGLVEYGYDFLRHNSVNDKSLTLVGDGELAAFQLVMLESWLEKSGHEINIVTHHSSAFENFLGEKRENSWLQDQVRSLITKYMKNWRNECEAVEAELLKWRELEPHMKTKVARPEFPEPKIKLYEGYTVTSVDKLTDREQIFLTLELPSWKNDDGQRRDLITLSQDKVIACTGFEVNQVPVRSLLRVDNEPGFMQMSWADSNEDLNLKTGLMKVEALIDQVFTYFSKG